MLAIFCSACKYHNNDPSASKSIKHKSWRILDASFKNESLIHYTYIFEPKSTVGSFGSFQPFGIFRLNKNSIPGFFPKLFSLNPPLVAPRGVRFNNTHIIEFNDRKITYNSGTILWMIISCSELPLVAPRGVGLEKYLQNWIQWPKKKH